MCSGFSFVASSPRECATNPARTFHPKKLTLRREKFADGYSELIAHIELDGADAGEFVKTMTGDWTTNTFSASPRLGEGSC